MKSRALLGVFLWLWMCMSAASAAKLDIVSTDYPPFNYLEHDKPAGLATDVLRAMLVHTDLTYTIEFLPWQRALLRVEKDPNVLIYTLARTPGREEQYEWIGPVAPRRVYFWKLKSRHDLKLDRLSDVRKFRVATVRADAQTDLMIKLDLLDPDKLAAVTNGDAAVRMLYAGRVDFIANSEIGMAWRLKFLSLDPAQVERSMMLVDSGGYYFALGKGADAALVRKLRRAFDQVKANGQADQVLMRYMPACPPGGACKSAR